MKNNYYVYRFKDKQENIIYVGRTHDLNQRFKQHEHLTDDVVKIEYIECANETDMVIKEIYYINLYFNKNSTNIKDIYDRPIDYGFTDEWKEYVKKQSELRQRTIRTIYNTEDYNKWSVVKLTIYYGEYESEAYLTHYDKDINKIKLSPFLYEAELFSNTAAYHIAENYNHIIELKEFENMDDDDDDDDEYGTSSSYFSCSKFDSECDCIQKQLLEKALNKNIIYQID